MEYLDFTKNFKSIYINDFIENKFGNIKLHKSKKRLELRLCKSIIKHRYSVLLY